MVAFADELLHRLELLEPAPGSLLVVHLPDDKRNWNMDGLDEVMKSCKLSGVMLLPPGAHMESLSPEQKTRLARKWLNESFEHRRK